MARPLAAAVAVGRHHRRLVVEAVTRVAPDCVGPSRVLPTRMGLRLLSSSVEGAEPRGTGSLHWSGLCSRWCSLEGPGWRQLGNSSVCQCSRVQPHVAEEGGTRSDALRTQRGVSSCCHCCSILTTIYSAKASEKYTRSSKRCARVVVTTVGRVVGSDTIRMCCLLAKSVGHFQVR